MNIKEIRQLIKLMIANDLTELDIADGEEKITIKRGTGGVPTVTGAGLGPLPARGPVAPPPEAGPPALEEPSEELLEIKSPMVGTFYTAASPDGEPYVQVGSSLGEEAVVCIIEAMKVMNEIKAECTGTIAEICVKNAQPVEFGQVLFRVKAQ